MTNFYRKAGDMDYDGLITDVNPAVRVAGGVIKQLAAEATYKRGTILAKSSKDNKLYILGTAAPTASQKFSGNASATTFTVTAKPASVSGVKVGTADATISDYNPYTGVVTLSSAPAAGTDNVVVTYPDGVLIPDCILCDEITVGDSADTKTAVYTAGCFALDKCTVASGYTVTESDKDKLRESGIVFKDASAAE